MEAKPDSMTLRKLSHDIRKYNHPKNNGET